MAPQSTPSMWFLAQNRHIWLVPLRSTVGAAPAHNPNMPSCRTVITAQCTGPCRPPRPRPLSRCWCWLVFLEHLCHELLSTPVMTTRLDYCALRQQLGSMSFDISARAFFQTIRRSPVRILDIRLFPMEFAHLAVALGRTACLISCA